LLIDFTVENFRSIKEPVTLSAIAQDRPARRSSEGPRGKRIIPDDEIAPPFVAEVRGFSLLPVLGIFGANASGKSNVLLALDTLIRLMAVGWLSPDFFSFVAQPFGLDPITRSQPSRFRLRMLSSGAVFDFEISLDAHRITSERLHYTPANSTRSRLLFERTWESAQNSYRWRNGKGLSSPYIQLEATLQPHEPFLHVLLMRFLVPILGDLTAWFRSVWPGTGLGQEGFDHRFTAVSLADIEPDKLKDVANFVRRFDTGLSDVEVYKISEDARSSGGVNYQVFAIHRQNDDEVRWPMAQESMGTQRLFVLAYKLMRTIDNSSVMMIDELGSNIHPNITREIVRLFQNPETNPKRAQLIFTSHDNTLQARNLLRRDQIWFTQKRSDGSTDLYPLTDFHPRNDLAIDKAYLDGRFGAVPILPSEEDMLPREKAA
jgi:hypothetical protein